MKTGVTGVMPIQVIQALEQGNKMEAIRRLRESRNMGLKEAKEAIEAYLHANPLVNTRFQENAKDKSGSIVGLFLFVVAAAFTYGLFESSVFQNIFKQEQNSTVVSTPMPHLFYPDTAAEAIALYQKSSPPPEFMRTYRYDELANDPLKAKYLLTKQAVEDYAKYLSYGSHKAFAVSGAGSYGYSGGDRVTLEVATEEALSYCVKYIKKGQRCYIVDINNIFLGKFKE